MIGGGEGEDGADDASVLDADFADIDAVLSRSDAAIEAAKAPGWHGRQNAGRHAAGCAADCRRARAGEMTGRGGFGRGGLFNSWEEHRARIEIEYNETFGQNLLPILFCLAGGYIGRNIAKRQICKLVLGPRKAR